VQIWHGVECLWCKTRVLLLLLLLLLLMLLLPPQQHAATPRRCNDAEWYCARYKNFGRIEDYVGDTQAHRVEYQAALIFNLLNGGGAWCARARARG